ncbi:MULTISPECIES: ATP synthase F1 subunit epsilon [Acaryochloris]|uniref:ATP synthase epsilon chain n=1 Tax=Acaryochloris marina (strain MBIC 11017) TaxID=329726 RepID=ATPE_ACAM1|nr:MULTISPECIES: ATP synthase F1 subunit epsilon [Acaryochloris]B0CAT4.1 RecName: Full=ATP synthase epsilon chain; AltName: Full=ATP synthase F1 sector epsilon subunit; AltName: Full=F-ATPase epsilon subunit [Acaryochloris marina MBIC11017]ABW30285.1 ATP synthase F1, epsilon subunit [Acaryochloris marina MBIC11017]BDM79110.1 ATP synthase epsilon chain [Acaryochloris marina MBIC10699]
MSLTVRVIAADKTVWDSAAEEVILPSTTGQLGILSGHAPLLSALDVGVMRVRPGKDWVSIALMGGFVEVENDEVVILVNGAERGDTIDREEARSTLSAAQARLDQSEQSEDKQERYEAQRDFKRARARLQASGEVVNI